MYNNNGTPTVCEDKIIDEMKIYDVIRGDTYGKDGKIVKVAYYNNGLVSESIDKMVINRRIISEEEKSSIKKEYKKLKEIRKNLSNTDNDIEKARKKAMEFRMTIESFY